MANTETPKPVHTIILDAGPIIKGEPSISTLLQQCEQIVTLPSVVSEIRDRETRARVETTLLPFLTLQSPKRESVSFVASFARKTGDYSVLSKTDIEAIALAYDIECERNGGDWRLRNAPGQKRTNGPPPSKTSEENSAEVSPTLQENASSQVAESAPQVEQVPESTPTENVSLQGNETSSEQQGGVPREAQQNTVEDITEQLEATEVQASDDSDSDGWITPSNIKKKQAKDDKIEAIVAGQTVIQAVSLCGCKRTETDPLRRL
jgi:RNA-binding protein NOB1